MTASTRNRKPATTKTPAMIRRILYDSPVGVAWARSHRAMKVATRADVSTGHAEAHSQ
jgi:hypothetical protein